CRAADQLAVEQQVEIYGARPVTHLAGPSQSSLNLQECPQEFVWFEFRLQLGSRVEKVPLPRWTADRCGLVIRRNLPDGDSGSLLKRLQCAVEVFATVAEIAAQGDVCRHAHAVCAPTRCSDVGCAPGELFYW